MLAIIFTGLAFAFFTCLVFLMRKPFLLANRIVIFFMISLSLPMIAKLKLFGINLMHLDNLEVFKASPLLFGPFLYLYTKSEISERPCFKKQYWFHFAPFVIAVILIFLFFRTDHKINPEAGTAKPVYENEKKERGVLLPSLGSMHNQQIHPRDIDPENFTGAAGPLPPKRAADRDAANAASVKYLSFCIVFSFLTYMILIIKLLRSHMKKIAEYYSYDSLRINLKWLKWITICFFLAYGFVLTANLISPVLIRHPLLNPRFAPDIGTTFFIFMFSLFAVRQPVIFSGSSFADASNDELNSNNDLNIKERKYEKSGLKDDDARNFLKSLEEYMISEKPFLDPDLTIVSVSEKLDIPKHYITEIINRMLNKNFYTYVNEFRINEAKQKISDETYGEYSIIRIAYDSGFNSKSTFNKIFKQLTSLTPSEYRQQYSEK